MQTKPLFLSGLNGIRAIAAFGVLISHVNMALSGYFNIRNFSLFGFDSNGNQDIWVLGEHGVTIFFVLSGFLITFLLKKEKEKMKTINIKAFYIRRILRIWPLYYFYLLITTAFIFLLYDQILGEDYFYYLAFLANIPFIENKIYHGLNHLWSIAVEEQFYLFWPFLFLYAKSHIKKVIIILIIFQALLRVFLWYKYPFTTIAILSNVNRFDCMMFGALLALLYLEKNKIISIFNTKALQICAWTVIFLLFVNIFEFINSIVEIFVVTLVTGILIIGQINLSNRMINLENNFMSYIGKLSFGIYVYHPLVIIVLSKVLKSVELNYFSSLKAILIFVITIFLTIIISHISYYTLEMRFLKMKHKFSFVASTNEKQIGT
ncbi:acyltransferase family protein [Chryseobacterium sp. CY353]|nr:acyltransferase [Chryseobacterium sp. CY353]